MCMLCNLLFVAICLVSCHVFCHCLILKLIMQDLCAICTDFIIAELWTSNFLAYQVWGALLSVCLPTLIFIMLCYPMQSHSDYRYLLRIKTMVFTGREFEMLVGATFAKVDLWS